MSSGTVFVSRGAVVYQLNMPVLMTDGTAFTRHVAHELGLGSVPVRLFLTDTQSITDIDLTELSDMYALQTALRRHNAGDNPVRVRYDMQAVEVSSPKRVSWLCCL